jgi:hypothetical protein
VKSPNTNKSSSDRARFERKSWGRTCSRKGRSKSFPARCDRRASKAALRPHLDN